MFICWSSRYGIPKFPGKVEFFDASLGLSIHKFHQNVKIVKFPDSHRSKETFHVAEYRNATKEIWNS